VLKERWVTKRISGTENAITPFIGLLNLKLHIQKIGVVWSLVTREESTLEVMSVVFSTSSLS